MTRPTRRSLPLLALPALLPRSAGAEEPAFDALFGRHVTLPADGVARVGYARWKAAAPDMAALDAWIAAAAARRHWPRGSLRPRPSPGTIMTGR